MQRLNLNGKSVKAIGIGTWHMGDNPSIRSREIESIRVGIQSGANVIDTAEMYGNGKSEELIGASIKGFNRENLFIISKFYPQNGEEPWLSEAFRIT
ncbi:aldo/keto reductase [Enterococcus faecalis]|uniref:aldo/keto reductase n=1 Tax=Enterococcus faecalis TaxID=1351 RepID=UPI0021570DA0|nr:aldo/keto reductase [Enterococcus faecalis]